MLGVVDPSAIVGNAVPKWIIESFGEKLLHDGRVLPVGQVLHLKQRIAIYFSSAKVSCDCYTTVALLTHDRHNCRNCCCS